MRNRIQKNDRVILVDNRIHPEIPNGTRGWAYHIATMMGGDVYVRWTDRSPDGSCIDDCYFPQSCLDHLSAVDRLAELVSADLGSGNTGPPSVLP